MASEKQDVVGSAERILERLVGFVQRSRLLLREYLLASARREPIGMQEPLSLEVAFIQQSRLQDKIVRQAEPREMVGLPGRLNGAARRAKSAPD